MTNTTEEKENLEALKSNTFFILDWITKDAPNAQLFPDKSKELVSVLNTDLMAFYTSFLWFLRDGDEHITAREHVRAIYKVLSGIREAQKLFSVHSGPSFIRRDALWVLLTGFLVCLLAEVKKETFALKDFDENITEDLILGVIAIMPKVWIENVCVIKATESGVLKISHVVPQTSHRVN